MNNILDLVLAAACIVTAITVTIMICEIRMKTFLDFTAGFIVGLVGTFLVIGMCVLLFKVLGAIIVICIVSFFWSLDRVLTRSLK